MCNISSRVCREGRASFIAFHLVLLSASRLWWDEGMKASDVNRRGDIEERPSSKKRRKNCCHLSSPFLFRPCTVQVVCLSAQVLFFLRGPSSSSIPGVEMFSFGGGVCFFQFTLMSLECTGTLSVAQIFLIQHAPKPPYVQYGGECLNSRYPINFSSSSPSVVL